MKNAVLAVREPADRDILRRVLGSEADFTENVSDAVELLAACIHKKADLLIVDASLPALHETKEIRWLREQGYVSCVIVLENPDGEMLGSGELNVIDGVLVHPIAPQNILPCYMMALARSRKTEELLRETEKLKHSLAVSRAMEFMKYELKESSAEITADPKAYLNSLSEVYSVPDGMEPEKIALIYYEISNQK